MRFLMVKLAALLSTIALLAAHTSSVACFYFILGEAKMPESLYIKE